MNRDFLELIKTRRSTRSFKPDPVPENLLDAVLEAGTYAPTGMNRQSPVIIAVSDKKYREKLSKLNAAVMGVDSDLQQASSIRHRLMHFPLRAITRTT